MEAKNSQKGSNVKKLLFGIILVALVVAGCTQEPRSGSSTSPAKTAGTQSLKARAMIILEDTLTGKDAHLRSSAIEITVETDQKDMLPHITRLTADPVVPVRFAAMVALGDTRRFSCEKIVRKALDDPNANVRIAAAYSLVKLNYPQFVEQIRAAAKSPGQTVRANATLLLGKIGNPDNIEPLYEVLQADDSADKVRLQAVESIARLGDERMYRSKLWALLISKFADDRVIGIRGMGALNTVESRDAIAKMLQDEILEVRLTAAEQLARLGDDRGQEEVLKYFKTSPDLNRPSMANGMAVMAIGYLENSQLNTYLPKALSSQSPNTQLLAARSVLMQLK
ncbi:MAG: HEAT repeat domain-containing protein [Planctomycetota bacterium]